LPGKWKRSAGRILPGLCFLCGLARAQSLAPRAYVIVPKDSSAIILTYGWYTGDVQLDSGAPIANLQSHASIPIFSFYHAFGLFGRSANITASLPYLVANYSGNVRESAQTAYRSGLMDTGYRLSINLVGGPAMSAGDFAKWQQKTLIGVSFAAIAPTGQYDPARLINPGANRWVFKPELGFSRRWNSWLLDTYTSGWFYTMNRRYFPGTWIQSENWIGAIEMHLSYDFRPRLWFSLDGNYWFGGATNLNGEETGGTRQGNSRIGATASVPLNQHHSLKFSYSTGARVRFGGDFENLSVAWQYGWTRKPK
jgi:Putative MetA-pathway of phenol degradation